MASDAVAGAAYADQVRDVVDGAPPTSEEQRERLAALLRPEVGGARAA